MTAAARAFVAVVPPPAVLDSVESVVTIVREHAGDGLRWSTRDRWHCTLQFLGPVSDVDAVVRAVGDRLRVIEPFTVQLGGAGAFPSTARATVLWVGVAAGRGQLDPLAGEVHHATVPLGFAGEAREFRPHLTVARAASARDVSDAIARLGAPALGPAWTVAEAVLFDSDRGYHELARVPLEGP